MTKGRLFGKDSMTEQQPAVHPPVFSDRLSEELKQYRGRYVAIDDDRDHVVASGSDGVDVFRQAQECGVSNPLLFYVPAHPGSLWIRSAIERT